MNNIFAHLPSLEGALQALGYMRTRSGTLAARPAANAVRSGSRYRATDIGVSGVGIVFISNGTIWQFDGPQIYARSGVAATHTGNTSETALATVTLAAGILGTNGGFMVLSTWDATNNANTKTARIRLGGISGTQLMSVGVTTSPTFHDMRRVRNRNAANSQINSSQSSAVLGSWGTSGAALVTAAIDTASAQDIVLSTQLANSADSQTLASYEVWVTP